ncbi:hypothetical protein O9993_08640 [Vibrio lentus]|nr:hypothetical protein [Vibrio lentus]
MFAATKADHAHRDQHPNLYHCYSRWYTLLGNMAFGTYRHELYGASRLFKRPVRVISRRLRQCPSTARCHFKQRASNHVSG